MTPDQARTKLETTLREIVPEADLSGGRGESHPPAPTDPGVRVSLHRALVILIIRN